MTGDYYDPVGDMFKRHIQWWRELLLTLMNEDITIGVGESMTISNDVAPLRFYFERLESEPDPRSIAQSIRRAEERDIRRIVDRSRLTVAMVIAHHKFKART